MPATEMKDHVYKILELIGSSEKSIEDAIQNAVTRASKTIRQRGASCSGPRLGARTNFKLDKPVGQTVFSLEVAN
jgi:hypothetical protein